MRSSSVWIEAVSTLSGAGLDVTTGSFVLAAGWQPLNSNTDNPREQAPKKTVRFIDQLLGVDARLTKANCLEKHVASMPNRARSQ
jgi:hypothetical protein